MNCLRTLLNRLADAASYWLQTPFDAAEELWLNQPQRDGADRLAEREAEIDVVEPNVCECGGIWGIWHDFDCDAARAGHCSAVKPDTNWAICTKPRGHDGPHGYGGIFWFGEPLAPTPQ